MNTSGEHPISGTAFTTPEDWEEKAKAVQRGDDRLRSLEVAVAKLIGRSQPAGDALLESLIQRLSELEVKARGMLDKPAWPTGPLTTEESEALKARGVVVQQKPASIWHDAKTDPPKQSGAFMAVRPALLGSDIRSILWFDLGSGEWAGTLNSLSVTHWTELPPMP